MQLEKIVYVHNIFGMYSPLGKRLRTHLESSCAPPENDPAGAHGHTFFNFAEFV